MSDFKPMAMSCKGRTKKLIEDLKCLKYYLSLKIQVLSFSRLSGYSISFQTCLASFSPLVVVSSFPRFVTEVLLESLSVPIASYL